MIVRKTRPEEARRVNELFAICFEQPYSNCPIDPEKDEAAHWAAFDEDGQMMSTFTISDFDIQFDGHVCAMGGVGGVATLPQYRRRGGIRACFQAALPELYGAGYDFSFLYPFSTAYYRKFGYACCVQKYGWEVDLAQMPPAETGLRFCLAEKHRPLAAAIQAVDAVWEDRFNMMVRHKPGDYGWADQADPAVSQEFTYVCFNDQDTPVAYTTFRAEKNGRDLVCSRFCFTCKEGFLGLMTLLGSFSSDHAHVRFQTPAIPALQYLLGEWSLGSVQWNLLASSGMVRVINVQSVLEKARYRGSGRVTLRIQDPQIPQNSGTFAIRFADGRAETVTRSEEEVDAVMTISTFSALIAGVCGFGEARYTFPGLEIRRETEALSQIFFSKPLMITDYF